MDDGHLEGESEPVEADAALRLKRPDAWAYGWDKQCLLILEFTRPNDRCALSFYLTDTRQRGNPLWNRCVGLFPGWEVKSYNIDFHDWHTGVICYIPMEHQLEMLWTDGCPDGTAHAGIGFTDSDTHGAH